MRDRTRSAWAFAALLAGCQSGIQVDTDAHLDAEDLILERNGQLDDDSAGGVELFETSATIRRAFVLDSGGSGIRVHHGRLDASDLLVRHAVSPSGQHRSGLVINGEAEGSVERVWLEYNGDNELNADTNVDLRITDLVAISSAIGPDLFYGAVVMRGRRQALSRALLVRDLAICDLLPGGARPPIGLHLRTPASAQIERFSIERGPGTGAYLEGGDLGLFNGVIREHAVGLAVPRGATFISRVLAGTHFEDNTRGLGVE